MALGRRRARDQSCIGLPGLIFGRSLRRLFDRAKIRVPAFPQRAFASTPNGDMVQGLARGPLKAEIRVRIPVSLPTL